MNRTRNGLHPNSVRAYHLGGDRPSLKQGLLKQLLTDSRAGRETSHLDANREGGSQYSARVKSLRDDGWPIVNRTERVNGAVCGWFRIDFQAMRARGQHDLLAIAFPDQYADGVPRVQVPLPPNNGTLPLFATPVRYADPEEVR